MTRLQEKHSSSRQLVKQNELGETASGSSEDPDENEEDKMEDGLLSNNPYMLLDNE